MIVDPPLPIVLENYRFRQRQMELERQAGPRLRHTPPCRSTGEAVELLANIEMPEDTEADPCVRAPWGLASSRSEFLFALNRESCPERKTIPGL